MQNIFNQYKKPVIFCLSAAIGSFILAFLAEPFLWLTATRQQAKSHSYCLVLDVSSSMAGEKMDQVKDAAKNFINRQNTQKDSIAVVIFSSVARIVVSSTDDKNRLTHDIEQLEARGETNFEAAMLKTQEALKDIKKGNASILLFTDGEPSTGNSEEAVMIAESLRKKGAQIFSVATADGDESYLTRITGNNNRVIMTDDERIETAFGQAETAMKQSLMGGGSSSVGMAFFRSGGWSIFLCAGIALALVNVQSYFMKKSFTSRKQLKKILVGSMMAGLISGFTGETAHQIFDVVRLGILGQVVGWVFLGGILAFGTTYFIPNINIRKAIRYGGVGGLLGSVAFLMIGLIIGSEILGRLIGACILGGIVGLFVVLAEIVSREVWLMVIRGPQDIVQVNLGPQPVTIGGNSTDIVILGPEGKIFDSFQMVGDTVQYKTKNEIRTLMPGDRIKVGDAEIVVCSKEKPYSASNQ